MATGHSKQVSFKAVSTVYCLFVIPVLTPLGGFPHKINEISLKNKTDIKPGFKTKTNLFDTILQKIQYFLTQQNTFGTYSYTWLEIQFCIFLQKPGVATFHIFSVKYSV